MKPLIKFAEDVGSPLLVLHDAASAAALDVGDADWAVHPVTGPFPDRKRWAGVALVLADRESLRQVAEALPILGHTRNIACVLTDEPHPTPVVPEADWPPISRLKARRVPEGSISVFRLSRPMSAQTLFQALANAAGTSRPTPGRVVLASPVRRRRFTLPPEIVVRANEGSPIQEYDPEVAPTPALVTDPILGRGPLDEGVYNPIGFHSEPTHGVVDLGNATEVTARSVSALRDHAATRVDWSEPTPELARSVARLAMAGIPIICDPPPPAARPWLGDALVAALTVEAVVTDPLRREEHSIRLRRAALLTHSGRGWQCRVAEAAGRLVPHFPTVSVILATRRPDQLGFAVGNVARQRGVEVELVVAAHGFEPDVQRTRDHFAGGTVEVVSLPTDTLFGDVLNAGVTASSGQIVVKMDDDDFYGPDFLLDLLLAREYSGADVVGTPAEFVYLEDLDLTVRRHGTQRDASERFAGLVAGGTITLPRGLLDEAGGFQPVHRFVDHQLFHATQSLGASTYRSHGLGFMLRRSSGGHTWTVGDEHFLDPQRLRQQWSGFTPTRILEPDQPEAP